MSCPVIELSMQLIRCPSLSPNDAGCQAIIVNRLQSIGFSVEYMNFVDTKNFWAWRGHGKTLAFAGHTDVVPVGKIDLWTSPPFKPIIRNGMLFGRGAADMKGSLAAMIVAAERFVSLHPNHKGRLAFLVTSNEETTTENGTARIIEILKMRNEYIDFCLVGEPSSKKILGDVIKNGRRGSLTCNLIVHGIQEHVTHSSLTDNLIYRTVSMLNELMEIEWDQGNEFFPPTSMQVSSIQTETVIENATPNNIVLQFNFLFGNELTDKIIKRDVTALLEKYKLQYKINWKLSGYPFLTECNKLTDVVIKTISHYNEVVPKLMTTGGTSDAHFIAQIGGEVLEFGPVNTTIHKINECVHAADLQLLSRMYQRIMEQLLTQKRNFDKN